MKNKHTVENHISWKINSGSSYFWWDEWLGIGALAGYKLYNSRPNNIRLSHFIVNGHWNELMVRQHAPPLLVPKILSTRFHYQEGVLDKAIWKANDSGKFNCSSAWEIIRQKKEKTLINKYSWHRNIPFKISFLVWSAPREKLPTNDKSITFGREPAACSCCLRPGLDNIEHIFVTGQFANHIWKCFSEYLGINHSHKPLRNLLMQWWTMQSKNEVQKNIFHSLPIFICWNLWKKRCSAKYGGNKSSIARVKFRIFKDTSLFLHTVYPYLSWPSNCRDLFIMLGRCTNEMKISAVTWYKPPANIYKLNTDGSALGNPGKIGGGGILRN